MQALPPNLTIAGRYRLVELLGSGGMSQVWRARDDVLGRLVAVKVLTAELVRDETTRDLLRREARAMAMVSDPHVANVHDYGEYDADGVVLPFVVMELVHGRTLAQALRNGPLPWPEAVRMAAQVASGLAAAHEHGVVHCDVTPANVVLTRSGVKVVDFGIATVLGASRAESRFGTVGYVAPESYDPQAPITPAVDIYSLGVVLFEALTGRLPDDLDESDNAAKDMAAKDMAAKDVAAQDVAAQDADRGADFGAWLAALVPGLPADVADVCWRCLATAPSARPRAVEVAAALSAIPTVDNGLSTIAPIAMPPRSTSPLPTVAVKRTAWPRLIAAGAAGLAIAAITALILTFGRGIQVATAPELSSTAAASARSTPAVTSPPPAASPTGRGNSAVATANLRQAVLAGQAAGEIRPQCAESLLSRISDLQRRIDRGDTDNARQRIEQIGEEIDDRASEGDVTRARAVTLHQILAAVDI